MAAGGHHDYSSGMPITSKIPSLLTDRPRTSVPPVAPQHTVAPQQQYAVAPQPPAGVSQALVQAAPQAVAQSMKNDHLGNPHRPMTGGLHDATPGLHDSERAIVPAMKTTGHHINPHIRSKMQRGDHHLFGTSEESVVVKHIQSLHSPDGYEYEYDSKYVLNIIEEIILRVSLIMPGITGMEKHKIKERLEELEGESISSGMTDLRDDLAYPINKISSELICKFHLNEDGRRVTEELFQSLASFSWEAKVVIAFAAFAMQYGEYWLVAQLYGSNPLARSVGLLREVPEIMGTTDGFGNKFKAIMDLVFAMLQVTKLLFEFKELLHRHHLSHDKEERIEAEAHFPYAAYWTVRSIVTSTKILMDLMAMGREYISNETKDWELSSLVHKLSQIKDLLLQEKQKHWLKLEEKRQYEAYLTLKRLFEVPHLDNMKILRALIYAKDDQLPLFDGTLKERVSLEVLRKKNVVLLVSGLDIPRQEFEMLIQMYSESKDPAVPYEDRFEMVWLPIIDRSTPLTDENLRRFHAVQATMPWYSVFHPAMVEPAVIKFMRDDMKFEHKAILVVLDPHGAKKNNNAINMYWIWGAQAFPLHESKEDALWVKADWNIELLVDSFDQNVVNWLQSDKFICVFGGGDLEWIRRFATASKLIAKQLQIPLEMLYVGRAASKERIKINSVIIERENIANVLPDYLMQFFWTRLNCMWNSRDKPGKPVELDDKLSRILEILTYDNSDVEWAVIGKGKGHIATKRGDIFLEVMNDFPNWGSRVTDDRYFIPILNEIFGERHPEHHCSRLFYPGEAVRAPHLISCPECGKSMEKYLMYKCCID